MSLHHHSCRRNRPLGTAAARVARDEGGLRAGRRARDRELRGAQLNAACARRARARHRARRVPLRRDARQPRAARERGRRRPHRAHGRVRDRLHPRRTLPRRARLQHQPRDVARPHRVDRGLEGRPGASRAILFLSPFLLLPRRSSAAWRRSRSGWAGDKKGVALLPRSRCVARCSAHTVSHCCPALTLYRALRSRSSRWCAGSSCAARRCST